MAKNKDRVCPHTKHVIGAYKRVPCWVDGSQYSDVAWVKHLNSSRAHFGCRCKLCKSSSKKNIIQDEETNIQDTNDTTKSEVPLIFSKSFVNTEPTNIQDRNDSPLPDVIKENIELKEENVRLKKKIKTIKKKHLDLLKDYGELQRKYETSTTKKNKLKSKYKNSKQENIILKQQNEKLNEKVYELDLQLSKFKNQLENIKKCFKSNRFSSFSNNTRTNSSDVSNGEKNKRFEDSFSTLQLIHGEEDPQKLLEILLTSKPGKEILKKKIHHLKKKLKKKHKKKQKQPVLLDKWSAIELQLKYNISDWQWGDFKKDFSIKNSLYSIKVCRKILKEHLNIVFNSEDLSASVDLSTAVNLVFQNEDFDKNQKKIFFKIAIDGVNCGSNLEMEVASLSLLGRKNSINFTYPLHLSPVHEDYEEIAKIMNPIILESQKLKNIEDFELVFFVVADLKALSCLVGKPNCYHYLSTHTCCFCNISSDEAKNTCKHEIDRDLKAEKEKILNSPKWNKEKNCWIYKNGPKMWSESNFGIKQPPIAIEIRLIFPCFLHMKFRIFDCLLDKLQTDATRRFNSKKQYEDYYIPLIKSFKWPLKKIGKKKPGYEDNRKQGISFFCGKEYEKITPEKIAQLIDLIYSKEEEIDLNQNLKLMWYQYFTILGILSLKKIEIEDRNSLNISLKTFHELYTAHYSFVTSYVHTLVCHVDQFLTELDKYGFTLKDLENQGVEGFNKSIKKNLFTNTNLGKTVTEQIQTSTWITVLAKKKNIDLNPKKRKLSENQIPNKKQKI